MRGAGRAEWAKGRDLAVPVAWEQGILVAVGYPTLELVLPFWLVVVLPPQRPRAEFCLSRNRQARHLPKTDGSSSFIQAVFRRLPTVGAQLWFHPFVLMFMLVITTH